MSSIGSRNDAARSRARSREQATYQYDVVETWTACVECGRPTTRNVERPAGRRGGGSYRACGCAGVVWHQGPLGGPWERIVTDGRRAGREAANAALVAALDRARGVGTGGGET